MRSFMADDRGAAAIEFTLGAALFVSVAVAATDLGGAIRAQMRTDVAVREAARMLAVAPLEATGAPSEAAVETITAIFATRIGRYGLAPQALPSGSASPGATCTLSGAFCWSVEEIPGAEPTLGRPRRVVTVWAAAGAPGRFIAFLDRRPDGGPFRVVSVQNQLHES